MRIIQEGNEGIIRLWGKQTAKPIQYRLMKYLIHETVDGKELLCSNVTGELVLLSDEEQKLIRSDVISYCDPLRDLVEHRFLVPLGYSEYQAVVGLRTVLRKLTSKPKYITHYTILPTTACNARCYYCFEKGSKFVTMTEQTASDTVAFIQKNCGGNPVQIDWFGGEPTVAHPRISQICRGLTECGVKFSSSMITNGYLFDEQLVNEAVDVWKMSFVRFSFDGTKDNYNKIKNYVGACEDPYEKVISAVGYFLKREVDVGVRMNFDIDTADDFPNLVSDLYARYGANKHLSVFTFPVHGEYINQNGVINHASDEWMTNTQIRLDDLSIAQGLYHRNDGLPSLEIWGCMAENAACAVITPEGGWCRCGSEYERQDFVGTICDGITNQGKYDSWETVAYPELCADCAFIPLCVPHPGCSGYGECYHLYRNQRMKDKCKSLGIMFKEDLTYEIR